MYPVDNNLESEFTLENSSVPVPEEPPFFVLMLGDWSGDALKKELEERRPIEIDRDNFDDVLRKLNVQIKLDWHDSEAEPLLLEFSELDDFHPDNLFRNVPLFSDLRDLRRRLSDPDSFNQAANEVRSWFRNNDNYSEVLPSSPQDDVSPVTSDNLLDFILSNPTESPSSVKPRIVDNTELGKFVSQIVSPHLIRIDENEQASLISVVDEAIAESMRAILQHPRFQSLESAWRGLYFLVRRVETAADLKIFISDASKEELCFNLKTVNSLADSFLCRQLSHHPQIAADQESFALVGGNYSFELNVDDVAALMRIGKILTPLQTPFISHIKPEIFGLKDFSDSSNASQLQLLSDSQEEKLWNAIRSAPESESLGFSPMRTLGRLPYGISTDPVETFSFEEVTDTPPHEHFLWINPCFSLILLLGQNFQLNGWEMSNGLRSDLDNLPLYHYSRNDETVTKPTAEIVLNDSSLEVILDQGLIPLISFRDSDKLRVARFQSISLSNRKLKARW